METELRILIKFLLLVFNMIVFNITLTSWVVILVLWSDIIIQLGLIVAVSGVFTVITYKTNAKIERYL